MKLDKATLATLTLPPGKSEHKFFDERLPGHGVRLRHPSDRSKWRWITQYDDIGGVTRTVTQGPVTLIEPGAALKRSKDLLASVRLGANPATEKQEARAKARETFGAILSKYLTKMRGDRRPRSFKELERHLMKYAKPLHSRALASIDRRAISGLISTIEEKSGPSAAIHAHGSLSGYFTWLMREGLLDQNPLPYTNKPETRPARDRVLTEAELRTLLAALPDDDYGDIIRLLVYTVARRDEIGGLRWDDINFEKALIEIPAERMKNGRAHQIPLSGPALAILKKRTQGDRDHVFGRGERGFQGWSRRRKDLDDRIAGPRPDWVLHDVRRTGSTVMHEQLGILPHIVERTLAHIGHQSGIAGKYNKADYIVEKRRALERWAEYVDAVVSGVPSKRKSGEIVQLHA
jgi:integrase